ncbi:Squalene synthase [Hibiscus syriacus]|uniref:Squalene synthase n=1 Tax=Hibiscus syriacus TaxID=106335 RepID=A0A6A3CXM0_HIBSY|nr:Squalene synthase [Hibiscus syriacus]
MALFNAVPPYFFSFDDSRILAGHLVNLYLVVPPPSLARRSSSKSLHVVTPTLTVDVTVLIRNSRALTLILRRRGPVRTPENAFDSHMPSPKRHRIDSDEDNLWEANCREKNEEIATRGMKFLNCWHAKGRGFTYVLRDIWIVYLCSWGHMDCLPIFFGTYGLFTYVLRDIWTDYLGLESEKKSKEEQDRSVLLSECQIRRELKLASRHAEKKILSEPHLAFCFSMLHKVSCSFAFIIQQLDTELRKAVCIFYLVLRVLDTVEDDTSVATDVKVPILKDFYRHIYDCNWHFSCEHLEVFSPSKEDSRFSVDYQEAIEDITKRMGAGMAKFICKEVETVDDYDEYCHYVAGLVGLGLSKLFHACGTEDLAPDSLSNLMGLFLQISSRMLQLQALFESLFDLCTVENRSGLHCHGWGLFKWHANWSKTS